MRTPIHNKPLTGLLILVGNLSLSLLAGGCYLPIFDPSQSMGSLITDRMEKRAELGPVTFSETHGSTPPVRTHFYPAKELNPTHGLAVLQWLDNTNYYGVSKMDGQTETSNAWEEGNDSLYKFAPPTLVQTYTDTTTSTSYYQISHPYGSGTNMNFCAKHDTGTRSLTQYGTYSGLDGWRFGAGAYILNPAWTMPMFNSNSLSFHALIYSDTDGKWYWSQGGTSVSFANSFGLTAPAVGTYFGVPDVGIVAGAAAVSDVETYFFFTQYLGEGEFKTFRWKSSGSNVAPILQDKMKGRVVTGLTSGEILSEEDDWIHIYSKEGQHKYSIPGGNLRFCYEWKRSETTVESVFSLVHYLASSQQFTAEVFAIPTARLSELAW